MNKAEPSEAARMFLDDARACLPKMCCAPEWKYGAYGLGRKYDAALREAGELKEGMAIAVQLAMAKLRKARDKAGAEVARLEQSVASHKQSKDRLSRRYAKARKLLGWARDIAHGARHDTDDWSRAVAALGVDGE